jgi:predicted NAD-dependent protein-ADP-ribosyltransferase YbiA (DUF1768 family)
LGDNQKSFDNAEAAFQALKFWIQHGDEFKRLSGDQAFQLRSKLGSEKKPDFSYGGYGNGWQGMLAVLEEKFKLPLMRDLLVATGDNYLIEHNSKAGRDSTWSDNADGTGTNFLGIQCMLLRDRITNKREWTEYFSRQIDCVCIHGNGQAKDGSTSQDIIKKACHGIIACLASQTESSVPCVNKAHGCTGSSYDGTPGHACAKSCREGNLRHQQNQQSSIARPDPPPTGNLNKLKLICSIPDCGKPPMDNKPGFCSQACAAKWETQKATRTIECQFVEDGRERVQLQ